MLQTPISKWKYIGMLDWTPQHSQQTEFLLTELELIMVTGLEMYPIYAKLEKIVFDIEGQRANSAKSISESKAANLKISGALLLKIFDDSYEKMSTGE